MESEPQLLRCYRRFDRLWFNDELPHDILIYYDAIGRSYGDCQQLEGGGAWSRTEAGEFIIRVNPSVRGWKAQREWVVLHEMAHIKLYPGTNHGKRFQAEMLRLATVGAFKSIW
jgi:predicted metal-dependent hydrolase